MTYGILSFGAYVPPLLHASAHAVLDSHVREIHGMLHQRGEALAARLAQPGRGGVGEIADFLLLQVINRHEPMFAHLQRLPVLHPSRTMNDSHAETIASLNLEICHRAGKQKGFSFHLPRVRVQTFLDTLVCCESGEEFRSILHFFQREPSERS